ncbi:MAG: nitrite/sulfite reductase [Chloroflexi bacterium]|nr:nitrite/sulfite reductase [Chloroflexota bacterium]
MSITQTIIPNLEETEPPLDTSLVMPEEIDRVRRTIAAYQAGSVDESLFRRFRLQHGIYGIRNQEGVQMVRVKVPFGRLTARQLEMLSHVADVYADGHGHVTTRQDLQLYYVPLGQVADLLAALGSVGLTTREASGNVVRNVTADPLAGVAPDEAFDVRPYADGVARFFLRNPICQDMGRKFKITFSGSPADRAYALMHDVGAIACLAKVNGRLVRGFNLFVGGGLGANPRLAQPLEAFTPEDQLFATIEAVIRVFDRLGERANRNKARMKFLIAQMGIDAFRELVFQERSVLPMLNARPYPHFNDDHIGWVEPPSPAPTPGERRPPGEDDEDFQRWVATNVVRQKQAGYAAVFVTLPGGDIQASQFRALAEIARRFAGGEVFTTITQNLVLRWVAAEALYGLYQRLDEIGLGAAGAHRLPDVVTCAGAETCNLGITTSHVLGLEIRRRLGQQGDNYLSDDLKGIDIKISGCPNACGHHHLAAIGFHGAARRINGQIVPHYRLFLGGRVSGDQTVLGTPVTLIPARNVPAAVERLIALFRAGRHAQETFQDWVDRVGPRALKNEFEDLQALPAPEEAPEAYRDWGRDIPFALETGEGECAA